MENIHEKKVIKLKIPYSQYLIFKFVSDQMHITVEDFVLRSALLKAEKVLAHLSTEKV